jgi:hypothetical protein
VVRRTLELGPKEPISADVWNAFLEQKPEVRARIELQTPWRKEKVGVEIAHIYTSLCGRIHGHQIGDQAVTISCQLLTAEECLAAAALLDDFLLWELDPRGLKNKYDGNVAKGRSGSKKRGK